MKHYAVVKVDTVCYGTGLTPREAIKDARQYNSFKNKACVKSLEANWGDITLLRCTKDFVREFNSIYSTKINYAQREDGTVCSEKELTK